MRYWQHTALLYHIRGAPVLVDVTNGNIPFLFIRGSEADRLLGYTAKPPVRVRMAVHEEDFYYHRVAQDIPEMLFFAMEGWIPYVDLVQVFDNELGLYISEDFMVTAAVYKDRHSLRGAPQRVPPGVRRIRPGLRSLPGLGPRYPAGATLRGGGTGRGRRRCSLPGTTSWNATTTATATATTPGSS